MSRIAILLPTRKRPEQLKRFCQSVKNTVSDIHKISLFLYIDEDDEETQEAVWTFDIPNPHITVGPRIVMSDMANVLYRKAKRFMEYVELQPYDLYFLAADDLLMETTGWDEMLIRAYDYLPKDKIAMFYGDDGNLVAHPPRFGTHPILTKEWIETVGYVQPPYFVCDYADTWLNYLADSISRKIEVPIKHPHLHYTVGKAKVDSTYTERRQEFYKQNVPALYESKADERIQDVVKLWSAIEASKPSVW